MQQSLIFLVIDEFFIHIMLCHRLYISIDSVDFFFDKLLYTYLIPYKQNILIFMQTRLP